MATNKPIEVKELFGDLEPANGDNKWFVIHTKPRCEKKLADFMWKDQTNYYLPLTESSKIYQRRKVTFSKPMFPGYVFAKLTLPEKRKLLFTGYIANFLKVINDKILTAELKEIYSGSEKGANYHNAEFLSKGVKVKIISGSLKGMTGFVKDISNAKKIILNISMLKQAVSATVNPDQLKIIK